MTPVYDSLCQQARGLLGDETDLIANAANLAALIAHELADLNWVGFYFYDGQELVLGPFHGKPACIRIPLDRGVCGAAARTREVQLVADVHAFEGHIACDPASKSEIVIPLLRDGRLWGVLDVDSPHAGRFSDSDVEGLSALAAIYMDSCSSLSCAALV